MMRLLTLLTLFSALPLAALSWEQPVPPAIHASALAADRVLDEKPCDWRPALEALFRPAVRDCRSAREATLAVASRLGELTGVRYDTSRRHPCMNALEALAEKKVSCTGQSILLVCALRSVGIPARAVGVWSWSHVRGNHTWVEAWFEGEWHMIEANEQAFDTPWVMEAIGMLTPQQRVLAAQPGGALRFPTVWDPQANVQAEDVTSRYHERARRWYASNGVPEGFQKLMVDVQPRPFLPRAVMLQDQSGRVLARTYLPGPQDDMRKYATLMLPRGVACYLRMEGSPNLTPLMANDSAVMILRLRLPQKP